MPQRYNRLRIHPAAVLGILICLGGSTVASVLTTPHAPAEPSPAPLAETIGARFAEDSLGFARLKGERIALHPDLAAFYAARGREPVWTDLATRHTVLALLADVAADGLDPAPYRTAALADLATADVQTGPDSLLADLDLLLTDAFVRAAEDLARPRADASELYGRRWHPHTRTVTPLAWLTEALANPNSAEAVSHAFNRARPQHPEYQALRGFLGRTLSTIHDWPTLLPGRALIPADVSPRVVRLRERMHLEGYASPTLPDSLAWIYDDDLAAAVRTFQAHRDLDTTGVVDQATRAALNDVPDDLIPLVQLNLERWRWLPEDFGDFHVLVNLPTFELVVREREGERTTEHLRMNVVVGRANGWKTPVFSDTMTQVIFNPTWTIPASIQREMYGEYRGQVVQEPGPRNPMRRVKFRFPNDMGIYIHDTTSRRSFTYEERDYSHGCIRAHDPQALAETILGRTNAWAPEDVASIFSGPWRQRPEDLDTGVPVHLVYFTAWPTPEGGVQTFDDVYGYDAPLAEVLGLELDLGG
ncbi:MAG: L,D-transpeptidase family protein [Rhodothermaceae bacterium]|nr:L,D-transpeptidase family protein [Rhodothermaceae bacterium]